MGKLEQEFLQTQKKKPRGWWKCTDDIFAIWTRDEPSVRTFLENLNLHHPPIEYTSFWSAEEAMYMYTPRST